MLGNIFLKALAQNSEIFARMAGLVVLVTGFTASLKKWERRHIFNRQTGINTIRDLGWRDFELLIGEAYRRQGYQVTETGGGGADGGIDLVLHGRGEHVLVQCKQWKVFKVGVKPIRELYGVLTAERADRAIFVTSGVYTQEARNFAAGKPLELIDGERLCKMIAPVRNQQTIKVDASPPAPMNPPACPICRSPMVLRTAKRGENAGSQFWGCSTFATTKCKGTRQLGMN
jgi:restriction system protein